MTRAALLQLASSDQPEDNLSIVTGMIAEAAEAGAEFVLSPEVTNCLSASRGHQQAVLSFEADDPVLAGMRASAAEHRVWLLIGSLALKTDDPDGRFANRSFLIAPDGAIRARYDKIHMFDVTISEREVYRESAGYRPGGDARVAATDFGSIGMTICYDLRFPHLYRTLAQSGATVMTVPSAFSPVTGAAHWETLLRARAIETGSFVLAPAQSGTHAASRGKQRTTYGHSLAVDPWGRVIADGGTAPGVTLVDFDQREAAKARARIPSLTDAPRFAGP